MINKKEISKAYKNQKHPVGLFSIKNKLENKIFIGISLKLPAQIRGITFELELGSHAYHDLAIDYKRLGKEQFEIYILDEIEVGLKPTGGSRIELETLEKMRRNGVVFYKKKLIAAKSIIRNYIFPPPKERRE